MEITEKQFSTQIESLLNHFGWRWTHFRPARTMKGWRTPLTGDKGFTDYCAVRNGMCLFIEIKSEKGKLTPEETAWMQDLKEVAQISLGVMYHLWHPSDMEPNGGKILEVLR